MKKQHKFISIFLVIVCLLSCFSFTVFASPAISYKKFITKSPDNFAKHVPAEVNEFALNNYLNMVEIAKENAYFYSLSLSAFESPKIGEPFIIYAPDGNSQLPVFHYPILGKDNQVILKLTVILSTQGCQGYIDDELVTILNNIEFYKKDYNFFSINDYIFSQGRDNKITCINQPLLEYPYDLSNYNSQKKVIIHALKKLSKYDVDAVINRSKKSIIIEGYTAGFDVNTNDGTTIEKRLALYNPKGQHGLDMCWAAASATIINYIKGTNITAYNVCDLLNINYDDGGSNVDANSAFQRYGIYDYVISNNVISWERVVRNIDNKKPVYMTMTGTNSEGKEVGHALSLVGYKSFRLNQYITVWDSNPNNGNGGYKIIYYAGKNTTFQLTSTSPIFTWVQSGYVYF